MLSFKKYITEIAVDPRFTPEISSPSFRSSNKIQPNTNSFNIIPIKLSYSIYNVFKKYVSPKFKYADNLLSRRGNAATDTEVKASNEEITNLKELAEFISNNATEEEKQVAKTAIQEIENNLIKTSH